MKFVILFFYEVYSRGEAAKMAHILESANLKQKYMYKNYEKIFE